MLRAVFAEDAGITVKGDASGAEIARAYANR
jgi:hypothetical protein